ncbi:hypothetical protein A2690_04415 [Candidatus Roizmanbacteria bacterium RIFCSPHIGHO2_01_FULL_39_12b]|uniref:Uncharacterized protein n=1 Tax=Candidatus Roizmanbacteria bacterium RIFCSPHIGHO2_01_FULL_39_12b TaxID=1802030 RepID=A0A1F7GAD1_9BACT|nr:MAG: hypothetical protein A2690_04415 [Candidatus Roizmanbacteria bacterium RIFCSPHIGHO2_01_FULL_39_12b]
MLIYERGVRFEKPVLDRSLEITSGLGIERKVLANVSRLFRELDRLSSDETPAILPLGEIARIFGLDIFPNRNEINPKFLYKSHNDKKGLTEWLDVVSRRFPDSFLKVTQRSVGISDTVVDLTERFLTRRCLPKTIEASSTTVVNRSSDRVHRTDGVIIVPQVDFWVRPINDFRATWNDPRVVKGRAMYTRAKLLIVYQGCGHTTFSCEVMPDAKMIKLSSASHLPNGSYDPESARTIHVDFKGKPVPVEKIAQMSRRKH